MVGNTTVYYTMYERERGRERLSMCVSYRERERGGGERDCLCVSYRERERERGGREIVCV